MSTYHGAPPSLGVPQPAPPRPVTVALSMWGGLTVATAVLAPTLSIAVIVLMFLPPTNRYAAARKLAR